MSGPAGCSAATLDLARARAHPEADPVDPATTEVVVGLGELAVSRDPGCVLVTYSLGSCVALALYDPAHRVGGLCHLQLPLSRLHPEEARARPARFVDTGVVALLEAMYRLGASSRGLVARVAGGASPLGVMAALQVGERNCIVLRRLLWKNGILVAREDVGGALPRTVRLRLADGRVTVTSPDRPDLEL